MHPLFLQPPPDDVSFSWRAGKAFKGESGAAESLLYSPFAAVCYKYGAGRASGSNGAENSFVPQLRLGGRRECVIKYYCRRGCYFRIPSGSGVNFPSGSFPSCNCSSGNCRIPFHSARFPVVFCPQGRNVCTALVQDKIIFPTVWLSVECSANSGTFRCAFVSRQQRFCGCGTLRCDFVPQLAYFCGWGTLGGEFVPR